MGTDLSSLLLVFTVLTNTLNITTESFYLGTDASNHVGGLNRHDTVECEISPNKEDYYLGCGDNHHISSRLFKQNVGYAAQDPNKEFSLDTMAAQYAESASFSQKYNPFLYYFPFPSIVSLGAFAFYPNFFSNGTYRAGGVANYESVSSIIGAKLDKKSGDFIYVPERWPKNWYRRSTPYGIIPALTDILAVIYPANPNPHAFCPARHRQPHPTDHSLRRLRRHQLRHTPCPWWCTRGWRCHHLLGPQQTCRCRHLQDRARLPSLQPQSQLELVPQQEEEGWQAQPAQVPVQGDRQQCLQQGLLQGCTDTANVPALFQSIDWPGGGREGCVRDGLSSHSLRFAGLQNK